MTSSSLQPTLDFYRRDGCHLCDDARHALQQVLEERAMRGDRIPRVRYLDVAASPALESEFGQRIPVIKLGDEEISLRMSRTTIATFLDRVLGRLA